MNRTLTRAMAALGLAAMALAAPAAPADTYPDRAIRIVVPYPPGGASDIFARLIGQKLAERLKQTVVVDNRPGAGGSIGADNVAKAAPDGYSLLLSDVAIYTISPLLYPKLPYRATDLAPVIGVSNSPQLLVTSTGSGLASMKDVLAREKAAPGGLNIASAGNGTGTHLSAVLLNRLAGTAIVHIPYKGGGAALNDVLSGQVEMMFIGTPPAMPLIRTGKLRALAVTTPQRAPGLPEVPTVAESGAPGFEAVARQGIFAPAGTPAAIVERLNREIGEVLQQAEVRKQWAELGAEPVRNSTAQFKAWLDEESQTWARVIREANVRID